MASYSNLRVASDGTNPNYQMDITADGVILMDGNNGLAFRNVSLTIDLTASGANGLDTGSEASNTTYFIWLIGKSDGTIAGLFSTSASSPTMPSGYTYKKLVGFNRNNGSSNLYGYRQINDNYTLDSLPNVLSATPATIVTNVDCSTLAPPAICRRIVMAPSWDNLSGSSRSVHFAYGDTTLAGWTVGTSWGSGPEAVASWAYFAYQPNPANRAGGVYIDTDSSGNFRYAAEAATGTLTLWIQGGVLNI